MRQRFFHLIHQNQAKISLRQMRQRSIDGDKFTIDFFCRRGAAGISQALAQQAEHFAIGAAKTLITGRSVFVSGMEMTIVGAVEAAITYSLGLLFHASGA